MKGIVFTEFIEMVEERFGFEVVDKIIAEADLPSEGVYTAVGSYDHQELLRLVARLAIHARVEVKELVMAFGEHLFGRFVDSYPEFLDGVDGLFTFLGSIEGHIHVEVLKLYPDAELPSFEYKIQSPDSLELVYRSPRPFSDFAEGLLIGAARYFGEQVDIERLSPEQGDSGSVRFLLTRTAMQPA